MPIPESVRGLDTKGLSCRWHQGLVKAERMNKSWVRHDTCCRLRQFTSPFITSARPFEPFYNRSQGRESEGRLSIDFSGFWEL